MIIQEKIKPNFNILQINCGQNIPTWENVAIGNSQLWCHRACVSPLQRTQFWETAHIFVVDIVENIHQNVSVHVTTWSGSPGKSNCTFISVPIVCCLFGCWLHHRFGARPVWPLLGFFFTRSWRLGFLSSSLFRNLVNSGLFSLAHLGIYENEEWSHWARLCRWCSAPFTSTLVLISPTSEGWVNLRLFSDWGVSPKPDR